MKSSYLHIIALVDKSKIIKSIASDFPFPLESEKKPLFKMSFAILKESMEKMYTDL